jgi:hypothetical protein
MRSCSRFETFPFRARCRAAAVYRMPRPSHTRSFSCRPSNAFPFAAGRPCPGCRSGPEPCPARSVNLSVCRPRPGCRSGPVPRSLREQPRARRCRLLCLCPFRPPLEWRIHKRNLVGLKDYFL